VADLREEVGRLRSDLAVESTTTLDQIAATRTGNRKNARLSVILIALSTVLGVTSGLFAAELLREPTVLQNSGYADLAVQYDAENPPIIVAALTDVQMSYTIWFPSELTGKRWDLTLGGEGAMSHILVNPSKDQTVKEMGGVVTVTGIVPPAGINDWIADDQSDSAHPCPGITRTASVC
jgi:hypothetical protein